MKRLSLLYGMMCACAMGAAADNNMWERFVNPQGDTRTKVWWFHGETETTEAGIDADLEAFKRQGVGGVVFYDQVHGKCEGADDAMSPRWWHTLKHAARKARELGLTFEVAASNGYVTGGPWITPELAMKKTAYTDTLVTVTGSGTLTLDLRGGGKGFCDVATVMFPRSAADTVIAMRRGEFTITLNDTIVEYDCGKPVEVGGISYMLSARGKGSTGSMNIPGAPQQRYFGAKYIDYPPVGELEYSLDGKRWDKAASLLPLENNIGHKSRRRSISFPSVTGRYFRLNLHDWTGGDDRYKSIKMGDVCLYPYDIIDNQEVKTGLRTEVVYPAATGGDRGSIAPGDVRDVTSGLSADGRLTVTVAPGTWRIIRFGYMPTGARTKHGRKNLLGLEADVMSARAASVHYDHYFKPVCDTLASIGCKPSGMCMDSHEAGTQNWTQGLERRFADTYGYSLVPWIPAFAGYIVGDRSRSDNVLRDFSRLVASTIADEYYGTLARRCAADGVEFTSQAMLNIDNDNIASRGRASKPQGEFWAYQVDGNYDCLDAASAAHLYGRPIASGEAFTDTPYSRTWDELLRIANIAYCRGINEFAVCASSYQPWPDVKYDDSASAHPYIFHRHNPAWESSGPFWDYQARCAGLLREGEPVVDLCVYIGEEPPLKTLAYKLPVMPQGYNFDVLNRESLLGRLSVMGGEIAVEGGMRYRALVVQDRTYISPEAEAKIRELEQQGACVVRCDKGATVADALAARRLAPDISIKGAGKPDDTVLHFHRRTHEGDIYFVYNHSPRPYSDTVRLRTDYTSAEYWDPRTATRRPATSTRPGTLDLTLPPYGSTFIITSRE